MLISDGFHIPVTCSRRSWSRTCTVYSLQLLDKCHIPVPRLCGVRSEARYSGQCVTVQLYNRDFCKRLTRAHRCSSDLACVLKSLSCSWAPVHGIQHNVTAQPHPQGLSRCVARPTSYLLHCAQAAPTKLQVPTNSASQSAVAQARRTPAVHALFTGFWVLLV